ncbi:hypothetical protein HYU15_02655 [Candidatus Woesearchaeota archaeon]|nr:hypothetical protein [Candidatus Woesearchaeota archaeon]
MKKPGFRFSTSHDEVLQLLRAWAAISFAFAVLLNRGFDFGGRFFYLMVVAAFTVGTGFLLHELAHKVLALRYGCRAEFRSFDLMLVLAVAMSFFGFIFAAPGAVFIEGRVNDRKNGIISAVGPLTNMLLAVLFFSASVAASTFSVALAEVMFYGSIINSWLAIFNLLPFANLDGTKVLRWSKTAYFSMLGLSFVLWLLPSALGAVRMFG